MQKIVECVPNFSEGRREEIIKAIVDEIESIQGVEIWDSTLDKDHNRTVVTFVGTPEQVEEAAIRSALKAAELIDMREHKGEHPRVGAAAVIPFVPLKGVSVGECVEIANRVAETLSKELSMPTYLYGEAATRPEMKNLATVQTVQYEGMFEKIKEKGYEPNFGPREMHPKFGASIVGARQILIAFNVNLGTDDISIARSIAREIRESNHGLKNVKAMGVRLKEKNIVQVSMDLVDYKKTPIYKPYELIKVEAKRYGVPVVGSELIGLVPTDALINAADYYLKLDRFNEEQLIEKRLHG